MEDLLFKIFVKIDYYEKDSIKMEKNFDCQVDSILEQFKKPNG